MTTTTRPLVLNVTEAGNLLGVSRSTAYELVRTGELESVQLRRRVVVPVAIVADRLGITVPDVWLALTRHGDVASNQVAPRSRPVLDVLVEDVPDDVHTELTSRARQLGQSLQQFLQTELEGLASRPLPAISPAGPRGIANAARASSPQPSRTGTEPGSKAATRLSDNQATEHRSV